MTDPSAGTRPYKLIAIDLDGTLLSPLGQVTPRTKAAVHRCLQHGLLICFATGRHWAESRAVLEAIEHYASAVFVGGAIVMDTEKRITLHRVAMDPDLARQLSATIEDEGHAVLAAQDHDPAGCDYVLTDSIEPTLETDRWLTQARAVVRRVPRLGQFDHAHTIRVSFVAAADELARVETIIADRFAERVFYHRIRIPGTRLELLETFDPSVNKWEGILQVARRHEIRPEQIIAIGDDLNDLHMIREAGLGVAMGNARDEVKAIAHRVIGTNEDDGLAVFLEELLESHQVEAAASDEAAA